MNKSKNGRLEISVPGFISSNSELDFYEDDGIPECTRLKIVHARP